MVVAALLLPWLCLWLSLLFAVACYYWPLFAVVVIDVVAVVVVVVVVAAFLVQPLARHKDTQTQQETPEGGRSYLLLYMLVPFSS